MKKRLVSALLALSMLCSAVPAPAFARGADSTGLEQEQCSCSIRCTADGMNPDCPVCAADAAACGAGLDPATVETADPEPTPEATATPEPTGSPAPAGEPVPQTLGAVPSLLAANDGASTRAAATTLTVGGTNVLSGGCWTTDENGKLTVTESTTDYNVKYDKDSGTLTLKDATINGTDTLYHVGAGIFASGDLTIVLEGSSTVKGVQDPNGDSQSIRVEGNLTIQGGGSLTAQGAETSSGSSYGIFVIGSFTQQGGSVTASGGNINGNYTSTGLYVYGSTVTVQGGTLTATGGDTSGSSYGISMFSSVTVNDAIVTATGGTGKYSYGLHIQSSSPSVTISGSSSLTARSGSGTNRAGGIYFQNPFGSAGSVTVGENSTLLTNSVLLYDNSFEAKPLAPTGDGSWLIYGQSDQPSAVGGTYTLTDDLTIENGNTFTIPAGSTLNLGGHTLTVDGTLNIANQSSLAGEGTLEAGENSTFNLTNPDPVISGSETLTYDGTDQFSKFKLEAPTGTVEVMGQPFNISDSPSLEGWSLNQQEVKNAGTYTLTASNGTTNIEKKVTVSPATISIKSATVEDKTYDGNQDATVTGVEFTGLVNSESLSSGTDYTVTATFADKNAGDGKQATVTVTLTDTVKNYTFASGGNTATATARIAPLPVVLTWSETTSFTYDGQPHSVTAEVTNKVDGDTLNLTYAGNTEKNVGNYTAKVTDLGNDNYTLTDASGMEQSWSIVEASIADATVELSGGPFTYNGSEQKPTVTVKLNGNALTEGDYTVTYSGNCTNAGTYTVTVTGTGSYSGTATEKPTYTINPAPLTISGATLAAKTYDGTTDATVTDVTFTEVQGSDALTLGNDYTATAVYADAGAGDNKTATVTVTLKNGNYKLASDTYQLTGQTIRKANWTGVTTAAGYVTSGQTESVKLPATPDGASYNNVATSNGVCDVAIQDGVLRYTGLDTVKQGTNYTVTVNVAGGNNYNDYTVTVTLQGCELMAADTQVKLKLETVQAVPGTAFDTPQKVESELARILVEQGSGFTAGNAAFYDVSLEYSQDGGHTWIKATAGNFPAEGITVTLPYPNGTGKDTHNFRVVHMFAVTSERLGTTAGDTETPAVTKTDAGIQVTLNGLSPVAIGWSEIETGTSSSATSTPAPTATPAPDGTVYYTCPACGHHDWTATDEGYRCDTCGYVESLKQLAGYGNVKGVYEPKTGSNTAGGHAVTVPQTGDTSNPALWLGLLLLSGLALGGITLYRRKKTQ